LRDSPEIERRTRELVAGEARCCPFVDFDLRRENWALVLDVVGPPDARPVIDALFEAARASAARSSRRSRWQRPPSSSAPP
jgi:hypothetical protein